MFIEYILTILSADLYIGQISEIIEGEDILKCLIFKVSTNENVKSTQSFSQKYVRMSKNQNGKRKKC